MTFKRAHKQPPPKKPAGYEHMTWATIRAMAATCQTQADRAGQSQDEVFARRLATPEDRADDAIAGIRAVTEAGLTEKQRAKLVEIHTAHAIRAIVDQIVESDPPPAKDDAQ